MFVSDYFKIDRNVLKEKGVFDSLIDYDSCFYINIVRLRQAKTEEFVQAYSKFIFFFEKFASLLESAEKPELSDVMYRSARKMVDFHEVNGINLGFSRSKYGKGWGNRLEDQFTLDSYNIVKKVGNKPELFQFVSLFEDEIAGDRVSDMIASIIEPEIKKYTLRIMNEIGVRKQDNPSFHYTTDGLMLNPFKDDTPILLVPEEIIHELPVMLGWDNADEVFLSNAAIRNEVQNEVVSVWKDWAIGKKKEYLKESIIMDRDKLDRIINSFKNTSLKGCDFSSDEFYYAKRIYEDIKGELKFISCMANPSSFESAKEILSIFKDWVENNRGWFVILEAPPRKREKIVQRLIHLSAKDYVKKNNWDISFEPDEGRGSLDIKLSKGNDKTIIEVKLSSNSQLQHGYDVQINEYSKSEETDNMIYVCIDTGYPKRVEELKKKYEKEKVKDRYPELVIIDSTKKESASVF